jgi:hypothetical protein
MSNHDSLFRQILGVETDYGFKKKQFEYQNIIDNVMLLDDETVQKINEVIVEMGHDVFKKKDTEALRLKTDSFVVKSRVHFPTDYNLLWDSARKSIDLIEQIVERYTQIKGWRNIRYWYKQLKNKSRQIAQSHKKNEENRKEIVLEYLEKAKLFSQKIKKERTHFPIIDNQDLLLQIALEYYEQMLDKHIDLLERRVIKGETIPHEEKVFSIFEPYTEWITKGKQNPNVELGKNLQITSDQFDLIIDFKIMEHEVDKSTVISLADRILQKYNVDGWSFDKGFYKKENKDILGLVIKNLTMPKKGKLNKTEYEQEHSLRFKKQRNKHSAIESNINELEYRGLDKCPDRGYEHFKRYIALGICAYNMHKIGNELQKQAKQKNKEKERKKQFRKAA